MAETVPSRGGRVGGGPQPRGLASKQTSASPHGISCGDMAIDIDIAVDIDIDLMRMYIYICTYRYMM